MIGAQVKLNPKIAVFAIAAVLILGYAYSRTADLLRVPRIIIIEPVNGSTITSSPTYIKGYVEHSVILMLNGRTIFSNKKGEFEERILLAPGYNILEVRAEDKFGRIATTKIEVVKK